jgi:hypothetical protein
MSGYPSKMRSFPVAPVMTGKRTTRKRSTTPALSKDRHRLRLPMVRSGRDSRCFISLTVSTGSPSINSVLAHDSGEVNVEENTTLGDAVKSASSSGISSAKPDISRYVVAPMRVVCSFSDAELMKSRYSGPSMPQKPGQSSAAA